jgi:transposase
LSPQQLFGWRRRLREAAAGYSETEELRFVPAVVDAVAPAPAVGRQLANGRSDAVLRFKVLPYRFTVIL